MDIELGKRAMLEVQSGDPRLFIESMFQIASKGNTIIPFKFNRLQNYMHENRTGRDYWLKFRQGGSSLYHIATDTATAMCVPNYTAAVITLSTDNGKTKERLFKHVTRFIENMPSEFKLELDMERKDAVAFSNGSQLYIGGVGSKDFARGETIHSLMVTELGSFTDSDAENVLTSSVESVVPGGKIVFETTPKTAGSYAHVFYEQCRRGEKPYSANFIPWWWAGDYSYGEGSFEALIRDRGPIEFTDEEAKLIDSFPVDGIPHENRIRWRRAKLADRETDFYSEYPEDDTSCVTADTVVTLGDGSREVISALAARDYKGEVLTVGGDGYLTTAKVTEWHRSPRRERRMYRLSYGYAKNTHGIQTRTLLTEEHQILAERGWTEARDLIPGEPIATGTPAPGPQTQAMILGSILGDAHVSPRRHMTVAQICEPLIGLKAKMLSPLGVRTSSHVQSGYGERLVYVATTKPQPYWAKLREEWYPEGIKRVPLEKVSYLDDMAIATWFLDDGSARLRPWRSLRPAAELATGVLPVPDVEHLVALLQERGLECKVMKQNLKYHKVQFSAEGSVNLLEMVAPYTPEAMRYKLCGYGEPLDESLYDPEPVETFWDSAVIEEIPIPMVRFKDGMREKHSTFYCMDVEGTHNFVTLGGVVHNCWAARTNSVFPADRIRHMTTEQREPMEVVDGALRIYKEASPMRRYVIGLDAAGGIPGGDYSAGVIQCVETGDIAAVFHGLVGGDTLARQLAEASLRYGRAMVGGERDAWTMPLMEKLEGLGISCYYHDDGKVGFPNTNTSRMQGIAALRSAISDGDFMAYDRLLIQEVANYERVTDSDTKVEKYSAPKGQHDDLCVAAQRAQQLRLSVPGQMTFNPRVQEAQMVSTYDIPRTGW